MKYHDKNGFGEWLFLAPGRTPEYGMGLIERIKGPVKISGVLKWFSLILRVVFKLKYHDKNGFGEWPFLDPGRTPEYGMGLIERM